MMAWQLNYRTPQRVPVEVEGITPRRLHGLSPDEVRELPVMVGNRRHTLGQLFEVSRVELGEDEANGTDAERSDPSASSEPATESTEPEAILFHGDLSGVHWVGAKMDGGTITVDGPVGRHVGSEMSAGRIDVHGNAGDWVGAEMKGGQLHVRGDAGHLVGAAYRGSRRGMTGGTLLIDGRVGNELGHTMRRGLIAVGGDAGDLIGFNMLAGTILVLGDVGIRHGAGMTRGTLALLNAADVKLLPTFRRAGRQPLLAIQLVLRHLQEAGFELDERLLDADLELYHGDMVSGGRGEILLSA